MQSDKSDTPLSDSMQRTQILGYTSIIAAPEDIEKLERSNNELRLKLDTALEILVEHGLESRVPDELMTESRLNKLRAEVERVNNLIDTVLTDKTYEGGVQFWIQIHDALAIEKTKLLGENITLQSQLKTAREALSELEKLGTCWQGQGVLGSQMFTMGSAIAVPCREALSNLEEKK